MKNIFPLLVLLMITIFSFESFAKKKELIWKNSKGWGVSSQYGKLYNTKSMETIKGEILEVEEVRPYSGMRAGIHLHIITDKDQAWVHLGPAWYILNQDVKFNIADMIEVTGSRISLADKHVIVAKEVIKNKEHLLLRDEIGTPFWCSKCSPLRRSYTEK